jgi:putative transposase
MALDQSALNELLDALRAGGDLDVVREALALVLQALIEAEAAQQIGAGRYERSAARTTHRNGSRGRLPSTKAGDVELKIPKLREGSFFPALLEPRRRIDRALLAVIMEAYVHGTSTRKVDDLVKALGVEAGISKSEVSRICAELDAEVAAFRSRSLSRTAFPYLFVDATYLKARVDGRVVSRAVVIATGVTTDGGRGVLGLDVGDSEDGAFWTAFLRSLKARRLQGRPAGHLRRPHRPHPGHQRRHGGCGLAAMPSAFPAQRPGQGPQGLSRDGRRGDPHDLRPADRRRGHRAGRQGRAMLAPKFPAVATMLADAKQDLTAFASFPPAHWAKVWSTNPLEQVNKRSSAARTWSESSLTMPPCFDSPAPC